MFGQNVIILPNGNIVISSPGDSSVTNKNGAVHLYNPHTQKLISSFYGEVIDEQFGSNTITVLANNKFVITSGLFNSIDGSVSMRLINADTGKQINKAIMGASTNKQVFIDSITVLPNNNFVIGTPLSDDDDGVANVGSVRLMNGTTGELIMNITGDSEGDSLGGNGGSIVSLPNNNFVILSPKDDENGIIDAGSIKLINGVTGAQIGNKIVGDNSKDLAFASIVALANNNFVISARLDDVNGVVNAGSVTLINGTTSNQISSSFMGDTEDNRIGLAKTNGAFAFANSNFVIASILDDVNGIVDAGSIMLVNGTTGTQIGSTLAGDVESDRLGEKGITILPNNNFAVASRIDNENNIAAAGSVRLMSGSTGEQINILTGDIENDQIGSGNVIALANNNFVVASELDDEGGIIDAGSVRLLNGVTGAQIGNTISGDIIGDRLGLNGITALPNNNFVIASSGDEENGIDDAGTVILVNGITGEQIGDTIAGDTNRAQLGSNGVFALVNNDFVVVSDSVRLINGTTGLQISNIMVWETAGDTNNATVTGSINGDYYILSLSEADKNGSVDSGLVRLIVQ